LALKCSTFINALDSFTVSHSSVMAVIEIR